MYKRTESKQLDVFKDMTNQLSSRKSKILNDKNGWHKIFYKEVYCRIDEDIFKSLYSDQLGRPNASIKVMMCMMILKEGNGWTDEQLYDNCRFNIRTMAALGLSHLKEDIPTEATFYEFRSKLCVYQSQTGRDLLKECFQLLTSGQMETYKVCGSQIRLDSKLINSNIKVCGRLELILKTVSKFIKPLEFSKTQKGMKRHFYSKLELLQKVKTHKICYSLTKEEKEEWLKSMGYVISFLLKNYKQAADYDLLKKVYSQQYEIKKSKDKVESKTDEKGGNPGSSNEQTIEPQDKKQIKSDSIQSPYDVDCSYRKKGNGRSAQQVNGYHANITETCSSENNLNLLTDYIVKSAEVSEAAFLLPSIKSTQQVIDKKKGKRNKRKKEKILEAITDGGYDSVDNVLKMSEDSQPNWSLVKFKGKPSKISFQLKRNKKLPIAKSVETGQNLPITEIIKGNKYRVKIEDKSRYYTIDEIEHQIRKQNLAKKITLESRQLRPNVESTIHQIFHKLGKRDKVKYRGIQKCNLYVGSRAIFTNFKRIVQSLSEKVQEKIENWIGDSVKNRQLFSKRFSLSLIILVVDQK